MRQLLKKIPFLRKAKRTVKKIRKAYDRRFGPARLKRMLEASPHPKVVIGSADRCGPGWIPTQEDFLNLVEPADWERFFRPNSIAAMLAEHVWEHLTKEEAREAARRCFEYLQPGATCGSRSPMGCIQ